MSALGIYKIVPCEGFRRVSLVEGSSGVTLLDAAAMLNGERLAPSWSPLQIEIVGESKGDEDCACPYWVSNAIVMSAQLIETLSGVLQEEEIEVLPLQCRHNQSGYEYDYSLINVINVIDCLDVGLSDIEYFSEGNIKRIRNYVFRDSMLGDTCLFKIPQALEFAVFCTEKFVDAFRGCGLEGVGFEKLFPQSRAWWRRVFG